MSETQQSEFSRTLAEVIVHWPLYRKFEFTGDHRIEYTHSYGSSHVFQLPLMIMIDCTSCGHPQPWDLEEPGKGLVSLGQHPVLQILIYDCRACHSRKQYWLRINGGSVGGFLTKIGQDPALALEPPPMVSAGMEKSDLKLYRQALTCRNSNFGIAAVAYLRRIVENRPPCQHS